MTDRTVINVATGEVSTRPLIEIEIELMNGVEPPEPTQEDRLAAVERLLDTILDTEGASPAEKLIAAEEVRDNSIKAPGKGKL